MANVQVAVNGRTYLVACEDGQEQHLQDLARDFDRRVTALAQSVGQIGENRLLLMAALLLADELGEVRAELLAVRGRAETRAEEAREESIAEAIEQLAQRLEAIAARLQAA